MKWEEAWKKKENPVQGHLFGLLCIWYIMQICFKLNNIFLLAIILQIYLDAM